MGHTDNSGKEDYNLTLSSQRAEVVAEFLLDRGVDSERVNFMEAFLRVQNKNFFLLVNRFVQKHVLLIKIVTGSKLGLKK